MFQEKEIETYRDTKAPVELKNRIQWSIERKQRMMRRQLSGLAAVACLAIVLLASGVIGRDNILSVENKNISQRTQKFNTSEMIQVSRYVEGANEPIMQVPMEIKAKGETKILVSEGTAITLDEAEDLQELTIRENATVYWLIYNANEEHRCVIRTEDKEYTYVLMYDEEESVFTIRQEK